MENEEESAVLESYPRFVSESFEGETADFAVVDSVFVVFFI